MVLECLESQSVDFIIQNHFFARPFLILDAIKKLRVLFFSQDTGPQLYFVAVVVVLWSEPTGLES